MENHSFLNLSSKIKEADPSQIFVLADSNTKKHCLPVFSKALQNDFQFQLLSFMAGEENKTIYTATELWEELAQKGADRNSLLINLGGGVVTDLGGFVASTYKRGIRFYNIPTSLLAMVDAAIGGKTGIDHRGVKNLVGTFAKAHGLFIHPKFLETLPAMEMRSGFAEILKHGLITDKTYWHQALDAWQTKSWNSLIMRSVEIKSAVVDQDPLEKNLRKMLNFGHTIGHALESYYLDKKQPLLHGEAIAAGMLMAAFLSEEKTGLASNQKDEIAHSVLKIFGKIQLEESEVSELISWIKHDKKNTGNRLNFVLLKEIGVPQIDVSITLSEVERAVRWYREIE